MWVNIVLSLLFACAAPINVNFIHKLETHTITVQSKTVASRIIACSAAKHEWKREHDIEHTSHLTHLRSACVSHNNINSTDIYACGSVALSAMYLPFFFDFFTSLHLNIQTRTGASRCAAHSRLTYILFFLSNFHVLFLRRSHLYKHTHTYTYTRESLSHSVHVFIYYFFPCTTIKAERTQDESNDGQQLFRKEKIKIKKKP